MSDSESAPIFRFDSEDPAMQRAYELARETFKCFWSELSWEYQRIVPALDLACVKAPFTDGDDVPRDDDTPEAEQMWMSEVEFDGQFVTGTLINSPRWLKTVEEGDLARFPLGEITDWMFAIDGKVYGAFTVHVLRSRMSDAERHEHDEAWGLDFGDFRKPRLPDTYAGKQHPMSENMAESLQEYLNEDPANLAATDDRGFTLLHRMALAGSLAGVKVLLEAGADRNARTESGMTPLQLAQSLGWKEIAQLLAVR